MFQAGKNILRKVLPPLLLLPLMAAPMDIATGIFWSVAFISAIVSIVHLLIWGYKNFISSKKSVPKNKLIRPVMTILIVTLSIISVEVSKIPAKEYVRKEAEKILSICNKNGECPDASDISHSGIPAKGYIAKYPIIYFLYDKKDFELMVRYSIDHGFVAHGGVNKALKFYKK